MRPAWQPGRRGGRLILPDGGALAVSARRGEVRFAGGALELQGVFPASGETDGIDLVIQHPRLPLEHVWIPHLTPEPGQVIGDAVFRSPAVLLATRTLVLALVPDLDDVRAAEGSFRTFLDYDHERRRIVYGAGAYRATGHVFFVREKAPARGQRVRLRLHVLVARGPAACANPYGVVARWLWRRWGRPGYTLGGSQRAPFGRYAEHVARWAFSREGWGDTVWQPLDLPPAGGGARGGERAGGPVFIVDVAQHPSVPAPARRWREPRSLWNQAWFSTQRCANGLYRYARRIGSADLEDRARAMTRFTLAAPQDDGLFPAVLVGSDDGWAHARWTNSDRRPPSASERACHLVDAAFTCRMLLAWHALTDDPEAPAYVQRFADRLVRLQRASGAFPGWVEPDGRVPTELAESAETAVSVTLLLELAGTAPDAAPSLRASALAGLAFLDGIVAEARWEDFETYYSCAPWGAPELLGRRVARNGVHKQNTLSIAWCAEAMLAAWRATGDRRRLRAARRCIDELSLYQAVWDPPFLPAPAHGGFGVMNADSEWNDARQSLFAPLYLDLYRATGDPELFERGASALRASFAMLYCPENEHLAHAYERRFPFFGPESYGFTMENQGHGTGDPIGTFTIFTWGNGSALATAATVRDEYGDLYVDTPRGRAFGIDGVTARVQGGRVQVEDRFGRREVLAVYADGTRRRVPLRAGRGEVGLSPR